MTTESHITQPVRHHLLAEYHTALQSAHHHEALMWCVPGFTFCADLILLGLALTSLGEPAARAALTAAAMIGILLCLFAWHVLGYFTTLVRQEYRHSREIELLLCLRQQPAPSRLARRNQRLLLAALLVALSLAWLIVLVSAWAV